MRNLIALFAYDESGATAIEYGLIAVLLSIAILVGVVAVGSKLGSQYDDLSAKVSAAAG